MPKYKVALRAELNAYVEADDEEPACLLAIGLVKDTWWHDSVECEYVHIIDIVGVENED